MKAKTIAIIVIILIASLYIYLLQIDMFIPQGSNFCWDKGFDATAWGGSYSEKYGKVKCGSCYDGECIYEEFNVTKKFGIIVAAEGQESKK